ncbi:MAG: class I SAM-dependent rRNA methyltransferase [candidate division FCPU426 bacterium]
MKSVQVSSRAALRLRRGYPWVFDNQITRLDPGLAPGELVSVAGPSGQALGFAYANPRSVITLRLLYTPATGRGRSEGPDEALEIGRKLDRALSRRRALKLDSDAWRLVWSEADGLPGFVCDLYGRIAVVQCLTAGAEQRRHWVADWLRTRLKPAGIFERSEGSGRAAEGLPPRREWLWTAGSGQMATACEIHEGPLRFEVDVAQGHKTGFYLDQRAARRRLRQARLQGRVLDGCAYTGGFSVSAASAGASEVLAVDASAQVLRQLARNAELNGCADRIRPRAADLFKLLPEAVARKERFQAVVLDPPPFAHARAELPSALRGYRELNRRAAQLLEPNGLLLSCACSHAVSRKAFHTVVSAAVRQAGRRLQAAEVFGPDEDHPEKSQVPESRYLTCVWGRVV